MENKYLGKILPFLNDIEKERREQFEQYFRTAPMWLMETFVLEELEAGTIFVQEGESVNMIYFIGKGLIKATDYRIYGINYDFTMFDKVYAFGGLEVIINLDKYQTTLQTVTKCTVLRIPKDGFKKWMSTDIIALQQESRLMGEYLLEQARESRILLFLQGADRVAFLLMKRYRKYAEKGILKMKSDRQELSDFTGLCIKTISRSMKKFKENGLISTQGSYIIINYEQYCQIKTLISEILAENL